nr:hypothetical protein [Tanacetum cinerariifolium]
MENVNNSTANEENVSYVKKLTNNLQLDDNAMFFVPTAMNKDGEEVVLFDEALVREGSEKWKLTVCGYFVGCRMNVNELKYYIRRMWRRHGLKDIVVDANEMLFNITLEAWSVKRISTIPSKFGRPIKMDQMTTTMCKEGFRRLGYARILVEINAEKNFTEKLEINYVDEEKTVKRTKSDPKKKEDANKDGFMEVRNKKNNGGKKVDGNYGMQGNDQVVKNDFGNNVNVKYTYKPKAPDSKPIAEPEKPVKSPIKTMNTPTVEKVWKVSSDNMNKLKKSANKYAVLSDDDMISAMRILWEAIERMENERSDVEDVFESQNQAVNILIADEEVTGSLLMQEQVVNFNVTLKPLKHSNESSVMTSNMCEFRDVVNSLEIKDLCNTGFYYTRTKSLKNLMKSTLKKLDRIMMNEEFFGKFRKAHAEEMKTGGQNPLNNGGKKVDGNYGMQGNDQVVKNDFGNNVNVKYTYKPKAPDPKPIAEPEKPVKSPIKTMNTPTVEKVWKVSSDNMNKLKKSANKYAVLSDDDMISAMRILWEAIERMENERSDVEDVFESQNQAVNILIADEVSMLKIKLKAAQSALNADPSCLLKIKDDVQLQNEYTIVIEDELKLLHEKERIHRLKEGDRNSAYIHRVIKERKHKGRVETICQEDGCRHEGDKLTEEEAVEMSKEVTNEEIKAALFDIDLGKAAGPDGYSSCFFKKSQ